ncbi:cation:proton antiporter [Methanosphaera cuniculi]|uniref:cation:proton antiporter n=1 Tax=Methanosphaera cuniculi TaxID=1077256 RepID=UPI0026DD0C25|nr:cation:proton antiporter [Methanosphaera cuniculi]
MDLQLLEMISIVLITAVIVLLIFNKLKLPSMIGLFLTGIILGFFIKSTTAISAISELGVIFLLFIIGLEFSAEKFSAIKHYALIGGLLQVVLTTLIVALIAFAVGVPINQAIFMGFLVCFSSTAIVMKIMQKKGLNHTLKGKVTLGILIFQDLAVIVVLLLTPILGGMTIDLSSLPSLLISVVGLIIVIAVGGIWAVPKALEEAASTKNRDLFMLLILFICLGTTYITTRLGIGPELGAFIAGLLISNTEYSHQTLGYIQPFQDVFMSLFLISIGLMINVEYFLYNIVIILLLAACIILIKFIATFITGRILHLKIPDIVGISILLSQIGEFSFVLATEGMKYGLLTADMFTGFLTISIITMSATPFFKDHIDKISEILEKLPYFKDHTHDGEINFTNRRSEYPELESELNNHVIIVGLGLTGKNIAFSCEHMNVPYVCVDYDPIVVEREKLSGVPVIYGDGFSESVLKELKVTSANCLIVTTSNQDHLEAIVDAAKRLNPNIHVIVRTRYVKNVDKLYDAGADEVIPEEFETSIIMFRLVMDYYNKDMGEINTVLQELRGERYQTLRKFTLAEPDMENQILESVYVEDEKTLDDFDFDKYDLSAISVIRDDDMMQIDGDNFYLEEDDMVLFRGNKDNVEEFFNQTDKM